MKQTTQGLALIVISSVLIACHSSSGDSSAGSTPPSPVGSFAKDMVLNQTSDDSDPVDVNAVNLQEPGEDEVYDFIDLES